MKRRIWLVLAILVVAVVGLVMRADVPTGPTTVRLSWVYSTNDVTDDLVFKVYASDDPKVALTNWTLFTTVGPGLRECVFQVTPGRHFWYVVASNFWGEAAPSNLAGTPNTPKLVTETAISR